LDKPDLCWGSGIDGLEVEVEVEVFTSCSDRLDGLLLPLLVSDGEGSLLMVAMLCLMSDARLVKRYNAHTLLNCREICCNDLICIDMRVVLRYMVLCH